MPKSPITKLSELLLSLNPYEFSTLAFLIGILLCEGLSADEQNSLGNFYELLGQTILTVGAQKQNLDDIQTTPNMDNAINILKNKIGNLENIIQEFKKI
ncbi:MAG: hypothetical protein K2I42_02465 [Anaeroplasmataceae bacterium]|nr:hypothetical protein [Anaeroplasmataceae bacterium]